MALKFLINMKMQTDAWFYMTQMPSNCFDFDTISRYAVCAVHVLVHMIDDVNALRTTLLLPIIIYFLYEGALSLQWKLQN